MAQYYKCYAKVGSKFWHFLSKIGKGFWHFCQSGEISPNLKTLTTSNLFCKTLQISKLVICFLNGPTTDSFSFIFGLFKQTVQFLQQIYVKKCPSSIWCRDSNSQPSEREYPPITTRPGLPPSKLWICYSTQFWPLICT